MIKFVYMSITIFLLIGCSSKEENIFRKNYKKNVMYNHALQKTEKMQFYDLDNNITKLLITATYKNSKSISKENIDDEFFIFGISIDDVEDNDFSLKDFSLLLNHKKVKSIKLLEEGDSLLKNISFASSWTKFYMVRFPHTSSKSLNLELNSKFYGKATASFAKVAKYILHKSY